MKRRPSSAGSRLLAGRPAGHTDTYVQRLKDLGFIIVGRTNTPEFGFKNISDASLHGPVNLPLDPSRNAGGSSGGAAKTGFRHGLYCGGIRWWWINSHPSLLQWLDRTQNQSWSDSSWTQVLSWLAGASVNFALIKSVRDTQRLLYHLGLSAGSPFPLAKLSEAEVFGKLSRPLKSPTIPSLQ